MIGQTVSHYRILEKLGEGGMGVVYKAEDTALQRIVALKFLPPEMTRDAEAKQRFLHEARAAAALDHSNICTVHEINETPAGEVYLVMACYDGETLREKVARGPLPLAEAVGLALQAGEGLAEAHAHGIVHRDVKPANLFVAAKGQVKILDFGLAKLAGASVLTKSGSTLGTAAYLSPEQARGEAVDARSDIWSLGVVLYELVAGRTPFQGDYAQAVMYGILNENPRLLTGVRTGVPPELERIVNKCLAKDPAERYPHAEDLLVDLRRVRAELGGTTPVPAGTGPLPAKPAAIRWFSGRRRVAVLTLAGVVLLAAAGLIVFRLKPAGTREPAVWPPMIVVLPFENLGPAEDAYFASGMAEEITSRLANVRGLGVISRTTAMEYNRKGKTIRQIGADLGVDYVLEGSVRWMHAPGQESRVRITPQLIRVADDTHIWADRYERVLADIFTIQSEVAESAVKAMGVTILPQEQTALKEISTNDLEAYDLYLRGQEFYRSSYDRQDLEASVKLYQAAVDRDPRFAHAFAGLARNHLLAYWMSDVWNPERLARGKEAAERAIELRPDLAESHDAMGWYAYLGRLDYPRALSEFAAALRIQPSNSDALYATGLVLRRQGRWSDSIEALRKALELDPKNAPLLQNIAETCVLDRRYAEADRAYGSAIALSPQWGDLYEGRSRIRIRWHGDIAGAQAVADEAGRVPGLRDQAGWLSWLAIELALYRRDYPAALQQLETAPRSPMDSQMRYWPFSLRRGLVLSAVGQKDLARRSFEAARLELAEKAAQRTDDDRFHGALGLACAGLGLSVEAVREAKRGCELMPASKDALRAPQRVMDLAMVYTMVGQPAEAIACLNELLSSSGVRTSHCLRLEPWWDPLRSDPRFQALVKKYEVKP